MIIVDIGIFTRHIIDVDPASNLKIIMKSVCKSLASEIGTPPDTVLAAKYAVEYGLTISYKKNDYTWSSNIDIESKSKVKDFLHKYSPDTRLKNHIVINNSDGSKFYFDSDFSDMMKNESRTNKLLFVFSIILILVISYFMTKRIFKPIRLLSDGVDKVSEGNLETIIKVKSKDELGKLTKQFNNMTNEIKVMIENKEQLLYDVSHELRTPITRIRLALELMAENSRKESISEDLREMELMIEEILETARLKNGERKLNLYEENIFDLVKEVLNKFYDSKHKIVLDMFPEKVLLTIDKDRISRVVKNLIENAVKYSTPDSAPINISFKKSDNNLSILIKDDGIGIPENELPNLFEPFYRVDHSRSKETGGFGLGLSLCKKIMEVHKGAISIRNNSDRGITVELKFPI